MALLSTMMPETRYKDPRANILYGGGNTRYSDAEIKSFINTPGRSDADIQGAALSYGISAAQISNAMKGDKRFESSNVDKYLEKQGITKDLNEPVPVAAAPERVAFNPISVGSNETVEGRMNGLLRDPHNPLNVQAQTFGAQQANKRGLLNSSIGISAAQDAMYKNAMPIATQDAATFYDAKKTNSVQGLNADMFNSDAGTRVNMFNAGNAKDMTISRETNNLNRYMANLDADNRMAIANIEAISRDTGVMGDMGKTYLSLMQQTASNIDLKPELRDQILNKLDSQFQSFSGIFPSLEKAGKKLVFGASNNNSGIGVTGGAEDPTKKPEATNIRSDGAVATPGKDGRIGSVGSVVPNQTGSGYTVYFFKGAHDASPVGVDTSNFKLTPQEAIGISRFNSLNGFERIKLDDVVPQSFVDEIARMNAQGMYGFSIDTFAAPIQPPGTMRTDMPAYYVWKAAVPKYS